MFLLLTMLILTMSKFSVYAKTTNETPLVPVEETEETSEEETTQAPKIDIKTKEITKIASQVYTGEDIEPQVKITGLKEGKDYTVNYKNNKNVGKATVTVTGIGNYTGTTKTTFEITAKQLKVTVKIKDQIYKGEKITPQVKIKGLTKDKDYTVSYKNNKNVGTATVIVTGKGNYTGTTTTTFKITAKKLKATVKIKDQIYKGKKVTPQVKIKGLTSGKDYKITYKNNNKIGKATVIVTGKGNYKGTLTATFKIVPNTVNKVRVTRTSTSAVLKWSKVTGAKGYTVYTYNPTTKKYKEYISTSKTSLTIKKLSASKDYYYAVKAYGGKYRSANYSKKAKASKVPNKVSNLKVARTSSNAITVSWKKISGVSNYELEYATQSNFKSAKTVIVSKSKSSKVLKGVSTSKTYYVRVRAVKTSGDSTTYGKYSFAKALKPSGYNSVYASYATRYSRSTTYDRTREVNLRLACNAINGTVLNPGQMFSFNQIVGERTEAKGYKPGHIFASGSTVSAIGGGVCQVASTIFNAALISNFKIDQRSQHSKRVAYVPLGRDAAIYWGSKDLKFTNTSNTNIKILASAKNGVISIKFMAYGNGSEHPPKVSLNVSRSGNTFTLKRSVGGKVNYTTRSTY